MSELAAEVRSRASLVRVPPGRTTPWYQQRRWLERAREYAQAYVSLYSSDEDPPQAAQVSSFRFDAVTSLIFESNTLEGAGLSEGDTRAVLSEAGVHRALSRSAPVRLLQATSLADMFELLFRGPPPDEVVLRFRGRSRGHREVIQHLQAWFELFGAAARHLAELQGFDLEALAREAADEAAHAAGLSGDWLSPLRRHDFFLSQHELRRAHHTLAEGLLGPDAKVAPGEYRIDHRIAGRATSFVAPELIPEAMAKLEADARQAYAVIEPFDPRAIELAADFSHRITAIHPFPDFNGRLSRLVLASCLEGVGIPFPVTLRSGKQARQRYLYSLRQADRGNLGPYSVLIARAIVEAFEQIDARLELAGVPRILPRA